MAADRETVSAIPESGRSAERCLSGSLKSINVSELLHFLAINRKTGKLTLKRRDSSGLLVLRNGRIIYAASSSVREAFGNILVCRGLISEATLAEALERQQWSGENRRLGVVLVDTGKVRPQDVSEVVRYQVGCVVAELDHWRDGFFRFDAMDIPEGGEIEVDAQDFVVAERLNTEHVLLAVATELDRQGRGGGENPSATEPTPASEADEPADAQPKKALPLSEILEELPTLVLHGEITQRVSRRASHSLNRGVLFIVRQDAAVGIGHFGLAAERAAGLRPERLRLPMELASVVSHVVQHQDRYHGPLPKEPGNDVLVGLLGGGRPPEVLVIPVLVGGTVALVLYGDNVPQNVPIGPFRALELTLAEAGLQIEKDMLDGRAKSLERARRSLSP